jgi:hypothetical protein
LAVAMLYDTNTTLYIVWFRKGNNRWLEQRCGTGAQGRKTADMYLNQRRQQGYQAYIETRNVRS